MRNVVLLYCGSSLTKSMYDCFLDLHVRPILLPSNTPLAMIMSLDPLGIIVGGSPDYVNGPNAPEVDPNLWNCGVPILGICYGMQLMARDLGGEVKRMAKPERELIAATFTDEPSVLFQDFADGGAPVWMLHTCKVTEVPPGFSVTATTEETEIAAMENEVEGLYAVQWHPEHRGRDPSSQAGTSMIWNFLTLVCGHEH